MNDHGHRPAVGSSGDAGYTLLELLVASLVISLAMGGLYAALSQSQTYFEAQAADVDLRQEARVALDQVVTELRHAGYDTGNVDEVLMQASDNAVQFAADIDDGDAGGPCDGALEGGANTGSERVSYSLDEGGRLLRGVDCWNGSGWVTGLSAAPVLAGLPTDIPIFAFFDETGTRVPVGGGILDSASRELVRSVQITFAVEDTSVQQQVGDEYTSYEIESRVRLRNMGNDE